MMARANFYDKEIPKEYIEKGYWQLPTLSEMWDRNAREYPDKEAIVDSRTRLTWAEAKKWIDRMAICFVELGLKKDDVMVLQLPNCVEFCLLRIALEKAGVFYLPALRTLRHEEMKFMLSHMRACGIVIPWKFRDFDYFQMIKELQSHLPALRHIFVVGDEVPEGTISVKEIVETPLEKKHPSDYLKGRGFQVTDISFVCHTTGTTGFPKFMEERVCTLVHSGVRGDGARIKLTSDDILAALSPTAIGPNVINYYAAPYYGAKVALLEHFSADEALKLIEKERVTVASGVPTQAVMMVKDVNPHNYNLDSLRAFWLPGAPLGYQDAVEVEERLHCHVIQVYGAVDFGGISSGSIEDSREVRFLTVGRPFEGNEMKLVDESGKEMPPGEIGEITVRGPCGGAGYYKDPEATKEAFTEDGWFRTGDLGRWDEDGNLRIVGRRKDVIIRGGQNIYPPEIENIMISHPKVAGAALVGMPDPVMGEKACLYVVPKAGVQFTFDEMISFMKGKGIAPYKLPERLELLKEMPLVAGMKVDKKVLREDIRQKLVAEGKA
jgi:non-ribosomal peptide synthetase component E (peptide arylation enzyme)